MINVFFPYYNCGDASRQEEIDLCLKNNIENKLIDRLIILIDDETKFETVDPRVTVTYLKQRPTYRLWVELTKELQLTGVTLLINSDIYFDDTLAVVTKIIDKNNKFLALSRWELLNKEITLHKKPHWSQDVWGYHSSTEFTKEMLASLDFPMGVPRCDNKVAYIFATRGFSIYNPCQFLHSVHVHETELRTYHKKLDERILGGVAYVYPGEQLTDEASLDFDIWVKRSASIKQVKINKSLEKWIAQDSKDKAAPVVLAAQPEKEFNPGDDNAEFSAATAAELLTALKKKKVITSYGISFEVLEDTEQVYFKNLYQPQRKIKVGKEFYNLNSGLANVVGLIPAVLSTYVHTIGIKPNDKDDINFWQYPCATEKQAYENHLNISTGKNIDFANRVVNIYVPIPWATYIDKKAYPDLYLSRVALLIDKYRQMAEDNGYKLAVHSVCQHIHWVRVLTKCAEIGITNLHLSHKDSKSDALQQEIGTNLRLHGWPLIAVNYEIAERSIGMVRKPMAERKLLASFIGAHMKHYRDDSRIRLFEAAKASGRTDVLVDLGTEWHFNKIVYQEQVLNKVVSAEHLDEHEQKTLRYNSILSDSKFSLCPEGAGPNTLRLWESIAIGSIPVLFKSDLDSLDKEILNNIIVIKDLDSSMFNTLDSYSDEDLDYMAANLQSYYLEKIKKKRAYS